MSKQHEQARRHLETHLARTARHLPYPPTPNLAERIELSGTTPSVPTRPRRQRLVWVALIAVLLSAALLAMPPVRAAIVEFLQIGAIRIFLIEPTPTSPPTATPLALVSAESPTPRPSPSPTSLVDLLDLAGETTLAEAQAQVDFPLRAPPEFGPPDRVFVQDFGGPVVILVWLAPNDPTRVRLSLHLLGPNTFAGKSAPATIEETTVHGQAALWLAGPHLVQFKDTGYNLTRLVEGHVLLWVEEGITYRLETDLSLPEAVQLAESLQVYDVLGEK